MIKKRFYIVNVENIDKHHSDLTNDEFIKHANDQQQYERTRKQKGLALDEFVEAFNDGYINSETDVIRLIISNK